jgi:Pex14 N-terminal domain
MSNPDDKKSSSSAAIPSWQTATESNQTSPPVPETTSKPEEQTHKTESPTATIPTGESDSKTALMDKAKTFMYHEDLRDAPTDEKISFLESKGLNAQEIAGLLGITRNEEASSTANTSGETTKASEESIAQKGNPNVIVSRLLPPV